jgi:hypothetical protein
MKELSRGDVVEGYVKAIKPYGAFVEIRYTLLAHAAIQFDKHTTESVGSFGVLTVGSGSCIVHA